MCRLSLVGVRELLSTESRSWLLTYCLSRRKHSRCLKALETTLLSCNLEWFPNFKLKKSINCMKYQDTYLPANSDSVCSKSQIRKRNSNNAFETVGNHLGNNLASISTRWHSRRQNELIHPFPLFHLLHVLRHDSRSFIDKP